MMAPATNTPTFHPFTRLSPEIRDQIWRAALPDEVTPVLYFYKKGGWCPRRLLPSDESNVDLEYRHDLLDAVQLEIPLFFVNHEARNITLARIRERNIDIRVYTTKYGKLQSPVFTTRFNPIHDVLYIARDKWDEFLYEADDRCFEPDIMEKLIHVPSADITRIAIPVELFRRKGDAAAALAEFIDRFFGKLKVLFIIINTPSNLQPRNNGRKMQLRWELKDMDKWAFFWNDDRGRFDFNKGEHIINEALYKLIEKINKRLGEKLINNSIRSFEVRPVFAVRA